jgi:radical SAM protein with 4Fe4S-binding SPASM domain
MLELLQKFGYRPRDCVWELTLACNMRCRHCGSYAGSRREAELGLDECLDVARQLADLGCERVTLGGGEPTLHPRWHVIARRLTDAGVKVNIISNGWRWGAPQLDQARRGGLVSAAFSLDGLEAVHDHVRRQGSFWRVLRAVDLCVAEGLPVAVNTTINSRNCDDLERIHRLLIDHGAFAWQLQVGTPTGNLSHNPGLVLPPDRLLDLIPLVARLRALPASPLEIQPADDIGYYGIHEQALRRRDGAVPFWIGCRAGCQVVGIESNGNVKGCLSLPSAEHGEDRFVEGNLRQATLEQLWRRPEAFAYNRAFDEGRLGGFCAVCRYRLFCRGGCSWAAFGHSGHRYDNPYCFYRQAVQHGRLELLAEEPTGAELDFFAASPASPFLPRSYS